MGTGSSSESALRVVPSSDVFSNKEMVALKSAWDDNGPEGSLLKDRHGFTHYIIDRPSTSKKGMQPSTTKGIIVLSHGLGTSVRVYHQLAAILVDDGYTVLRYDFYNHGYSKYAGGLFGKDVWIKYTVDLFVDQLEDLLLHVCAETKETVVGIVGHSTGGVVAVASNARWRTKEAKRDVIPSVVLANPALFLFKKPFAQASADMFPNLLLFLFKIIPFLRFLVKTNYEAAGEKGFAIDPRTNQAVYPDAKDKQSMVTRRCFGRVKGEREHPFIVPGIYGAGAFTLGAKLLAGHRELLLGNLTSSPDSKVHWIWGNLDLTVPYTENIGEAEGWAKNYDNFSLSTIDRLGHEFFFEDTERVSKDILPFLNKS